MKAFTPSPGFLAYYNTVIAAARQPLSFGMGPLFLPLPAGLSDEEQAFCIVKLVPLIDTVNRYRASVPAL